MNADFGTYGLILLTFAQVAATLTGFIGVVFVLGERQRGTLDTHEAQAVFHLLFSALSALFSSLLAGILLAYYASDQHTAWRIANALVGAIHFFGAGRLAFEARRNMDGIPRASLMVALGMTVAGLGFAAADGYFVHEVALLFMLSTLWLLGVTVISFVSLMTSAAQPST
ncbi:MAG TPA: hypothetical protein VMT61_07650 [Candidatus Binataceae bacterium]|nr:hypothetical protein [Candidatus Binataceae bacterium]